MTFPPYLLIEKGFFTMTDNNLNKFEQDQTAETVVDTSKKLRVGIIGCGCIAESHCQSYKRQPDVEIVALAEIVDGRAEDFAKRYELGDVHIYKDYKEMLAKEKLDCVSVCTYTRQHAPCSIAALDAGVNVICEKPMCVTLEEGIEMMKAEKRSGKLLTIGFQPRFNDNMKQIKKIVDSGALGDVYYIQTGGGRRCGIPMGHECSFIKDETAGLGALGDIGCYSLDMVLNAVGYPKPLSVSGDITRYFGTDPDYYKDGEIGYGGVRLDPEFAKIFTVDDWASAFVRLEGGIILDFRIAWAMNIDSPCDTIILGTKGGLRIPATDCWNGSIGGPMTVYTEVAGQQTEYQIPMLPNNDLWYLKLRTFLDAIKNGTPAPVPTSQIIRNQAILDGILRSSKAGREVEINIPDID